MILDIRNIIKGIDFNTKTAKHFSDVFERAVLKNIKLSIYFNFNDISKSDEEVNCDFGVAGKIGPKDESIYVFHVQEDDDEWFEVPLLYFLNKFTKDDLLEIKNAAIKLRDLSPSEGGEEEDE